MTNNNNTIRKMKQVSHILWYTVYLRVDSAYRYPLFITSIIIIIHYFFTTIDTTR